MKGWELALLALIALLPRLVHLDHPPQFDELYHTLAARSWAADGTLSLGDGVYDRTALFTQLIGLLFRFFDDTLVVARVPSVVAGTAWVILVAWWTSASAGRAAGWIAGLLFAGDPGAIYLSQFARFYAVHGLLFFAGASATFNLIAHWPVRSAAWKGRVAALAAAALLAALYLQVTTLIGMVPLAVWAGWRLAPRWWAAWKRGGVPRWLPVVATAVVLVLAAFWATGDSAAGLWQTYRGTALWLVAHVDRVRFYELWLLARYPVFWTLLPLAFLVAAWRFRQAAMFAATVFGLALVLHSFAGAKTERYLYFAMPFFFILWGLAVAAALPAFHRVVQEGLSSALRVPVRLQKRFSWAIFVAVALIFAYYNPATRMSRHLVVPGDEARPYPDPDWSKAAPDLRRLADSADVVVSSALPKAIYYLGRGDVTLSLTELAEFGMQDGKMVEFAVDPRTGRPAISTPGSLERLMGCFARGLLIIEDGHLHATVIVPDSTVTYLNGTTRETPLDPAWRIRAFRWQRDSAETRLNCPRAHERVPYSDR